MCKSNKVPERRNQRGAAMAEFVIVAPVLIMILFSIIQFGLVINRVQTFNAAAREGARVASLQSSTQSEIEDAASNTLDGLSLGISETVNVSQLCSQGPSTVTVTVTGPYTIQIPLIPDKNITLTGRGVFRCES